MVGWRCCWRGIAGGSLDEERLVVRIAGGWVEEELLVWDGLTSDEVETLLLLVGMARAGCGMRRRHCC